MEMIEQGIVIRAGVGDAHAMICAEGAGYAPDLVHDMMNRATDLVENILLIARDTGYIDIQPPEVDEDEDDEEEVVENGDSEWWIQ
jgi:hypothetical protein